MPNFRIGLAQDLPGSEPVTLTVVTTFNDQTKNYTSVQAVGQVADKANITVNSVVNFMNQVNVLSRMLASTYSKGPTPVEIEIFSMNNA